MSIARNFIHLMSIVLLCFGCAVSQSEQSQNNDIEDSIITEKIKASLLEEVDLKGSDISVETFHGRVYLRGAVESLHQMDKAAEIVRNVKGVRAVVNDLRVKPLDKK